MLALKRLGFQLGEGHFGTVLLGVMSEHDTKQNVAVKSVTKSAGVKDVLDEAMALGIKSHPNVLHLLGIFLDDARSLYVATEFCVYGDLQKFLQQRKTTFSSLLDGNGDDFIRSAALHYKISFLD